jgi:hypothetical protein
MTKILIRRLVRRSDQREPHAENGDIGTDIQRERQRSNRSKTGIF